LNNITEKRKLLEEQFASANDDISKVDLLNSFAFEIRHTNSSLSIQKSLQAAELSEKVNYRKGLASAFLNKGFGEMVQADYANAFQTLQKAAGIFEAINDDAGQAHAFYNIGVVYSRIAEYNLSFESFQKSLGIRHSLGNEKGEAVCISQIAYIYDKFGNVEEAYDYYTKCLAIQRRIDDKPAIALTLMGIGILKQKRHEYEDAERDLLESLSIRDTIGETHGSLVSMNYLAEFYLERNQLEKAKNYLFAAIEKAKKEIPPFPANLCRLYTSVVKVFTQSGNYGEAIIHSEMALKIAKENNLKYQVYDIYLALTNLYRQKGDFELALASYEKYHLAKEETINLKASTQLKNLQLSNQIEDEKKKAEIHAQHNKELEKAYDQLKATQAQLIQSEKMASLGEVTAGIAHEIQNPLNFVNNFSDLNKELLIEMKDEMNKGNIDDANAIANDVIENEQKINHHGKRAGDIVKGMLQHSRTSAGKKEPTNINSLADEYLHLSYHGLRAKDKTFNAEMITDFDTTIGKINIVPQDIGRVLLNLYNNAFYEVNEKAKLSANSYHPTVSVMTKRLDNSITITVSDNGGGISQNIANKIFQPFFTTKPTGSGTGLGLSLSYDIVKAHGGEIKVEGNEGEARPLDRSDHSSGDALVGQGSKFIIVLPIS